MKWTGLLVLLLMSCMTFAADKGAAKAIIVKGKVSATIKGKKVKVKKGMWLPEGALIETQKKSFTKLLFIDKSSMNVGPESRMKIDTFPKKDAGIITLIKGQIRSKVTKNYMDMKKKDKSKLFIKTETAAMGVRGTDFIVSFNPVNKATSLITFEGAVAMAKIPKNVGSNQRSLERVVSSPTAVIVKKGQYSGANGSASRATLPVKVSPVQIEALEQAEVPGMANTEASSSDSSGGSSGGTKAKKAKPKKKFKSIVPPGVDPVSMANETTEVSKSLGGVIGSDTMQKVEVEVKQETAHFNNAAAPEGVSNSATGEYAPKSGGIIDLKSASYIPPPEDAVFDSNANVYVMPTDMGYVDPETGDYKNDFYQVNAEGKFEAKPQENIPGRDIASVDGNDATTSKEPIADAPPPPPEIDSNVASETIAGDFGGTLDSNRDPATLIDVPIINLPPEIPDAPLPPGPPPTVGGKTRARFNINAP